MVALDLKLFSAVTLGGQVLKNRMVMAPMTRARCTPNLEDPYDPINTQPNDLMAEYYAQRASAGLIITEATAISEMGSGWARAPNICTPENVDGWKKVVDSVHEKDGRIYLQLWHMVSDDTTEGRMSNGCQDDLSHLLLLLLLLLYGVVVVWWWWCMVVVYVGICRVGSRIHRIIRPPRKPCRHRRLPLRERCTTFTATRSRTRFHGP